VDCDTGVDDAVALLSLSRLHRDDLRLKLVTTVAGNVSVRRTSANTSYVLASGGVVDVPVYRGAAKPLVGRRAAAGAQKFHGVDGLGGCYPKARPSPRLPDNAAAQLVNAIADWSFEGPCWVLATGPLTNLALAFDLAPSVVSRIDRLVIMGGGLGSPSGNITPWAEFNFYMDPEAADVVLRSGAPIELVPLDVTQRVVVEPSRAFSQRLTPLADCLVRASLDAHKRAFGLEGCYLHDATAAALLIDRSLGKTRRLFVGVETEGRQRGHLTSDAASHRRSSVEVVVDVNAHEIMTQLFGLLAV
jgi:inosine-uridine nucleoside N-ribohydrolase